MQLDRFYTLPYIYPYSLFDTDASMAGVSLEKSFDGLFETTPTMGYALNELRPEGKLPALVGINDEGEYITFDASKCHMMLAGGTGSGKTCHLNSVMISLVHWAHPEYLKLAIIDGKETDLVAWEKVATVAKSYEQTCDLLEKLDTEMRRRQVLLQKKGGKSAITNAHEQNAFAYQRREKGGVLPFIFIVVDEYAEVLSKLDADADKERGRRCRGYFESLVRLGRSAGISICLTSQTTYAADFPGTIKGNIVERRCMCTGSNIQEKTILEAPYNTDSLKAYNLEIGEFLRVEKGHRVRYKTVYSSGKCLQKALERWKAGGFDFSL